MTDGAVWKLDMQTEEWKDITPDRPVKGSREFGYAAVSVDAKHPQTVIVQLYDRTRLAAKISSDRRTAVPRGNRFSRRRRRDV